METTLVRLIDPILIEIESESPGTRKMLERVPEDQWDWAPHPKSMKLGFLASHIAENPRWVLPVLDLEEFRFQSADYKPWVARDRAELLARFDEYLSKAKAALADCSNEKLMAPWRFYVDGELVLDSPRIDALRSFYLNHTVHHRAQLSVYLRLLNVPLPSIYGPSADEQV